MRPQIPDNIKQEVIRQWLSGHSRDEIAKNNNISAGATTNIISEWTRALGKPEAAALREFSRLMRSSGLSPVQGAVGFRTVNMLTKHGIDQDKAEQFVSTTIKKCEDRGITPDKIVTHVEDLTKFSDHTRLSEIEDYVEEKTNKIRELERKKLELREQVNCMQAEMTQLEKSRDVIFEQKRTATEEMKSYFDARQLLDKYGISITEDIPKLAKTVEGVAQYGHDPKILILEFNDIQRHRDENEALKTATEGMQNDVLRLDRQLHTIRADINSHSEQLSILNRLDAYGCNSKVLKSLIETILNIAGSNGIIPWLALDKFIEDVKTQYDPKLGFESEIEDLNIDIQILKKERENRLNSLENYPRVAIVVRKLLQRGFTETDILHLGQVYLDILNSRYTAKDLAIGMIKTLDMMISSGPNQSETTHGKDKLTDILVKARVDLSQIHHSS